MLTKKQVIEIREELNKANEPLFLFDNDPDGLCSFLLLRKYIGKGKGFPIKSFQDSGGNYLRKIKELNPDYIFILDKPAIPLDFFKKLNEMNLPVVWIDHHEVNESQIPDFVKYYNPLFNRKKSNEPVTALCYQINHNNALDWLASVGCVSDRFLPRFYSKIVKKYPDLTMKSKDPFEVFYNSQLGRIARMFSFALKDRTTNVITMIKFLMRINTPYEILADSSQNYTMHKRFEQVESKFQKLVGKALNFSGNKKILYFQYGGELSISSDLSNFLSYKFPGKVIIVAYISGSKANISIRGKNIRDKVMKSIGEIEGASGGGHEDAVGVQIRADKLELFKEKLHQLI